MAFCFFGFFHRWTGVFLPRSGDNAETLGKTEFRFACLWDGRGKSRKPAEKCVSNLKLSGWDGGNENRRVFACSRAAMINNSSPSDGQEGCAEQFLERQTYPRGLESLAAAEPGGMPPVRQFVGNMQICTRICKKRPAEVLPAVCCSLAEKIQLFSAFWAFFARRFSRWARWRRDTVSVSRMP